VKGKKDTEKKMVRIGPHGNGKGDYLGEPKNKTRRRGREGGGKNQQRGMKETGEEKLGG